MTIKQYKKNICAEERAAIAALAVFLDDPRANIFVTIEERIATACASIRDLVAQGADRQLASLMAWKFVNKILKDTLQDNIVGLRRLDEKAPIWFACGYEFCFHVTCRDERKSPDDVFPRKNVNIVKRMEKNLEDHELVLEYLPQLDLFKEASKYVLRKKDGTPIRMVIMLQYSLNEGLVYAAIGVPRNIEESRITSWSGYATIAINRGGDRPPGERSVKDDIPPAPLAPKPQVKRPSVRRRSTSADDIKHEPTSKK